MLRPIPTSPARRRRAVAAIPALALLGLAHPVLGQAKRCDLVGQDTVVAGTGMKRCLDLAALDGDTVIVPSNTTRIDNDGLSLCKSSVQSGGNADIVYVYDNSGSMRASYAWVNASGTDTLFYEGRDGCSNQNTSGSVTYTAFNSAGTGTVQRTIPRLVSNSGCYATSGDPYYARGRAIRLGINFQANRAPQSTAGIMSFTNHGWNTPAVRNVRQPLPLNSSANISTIHSGINVVSDGGTNYRPPLDSAKRWLTNGSITSNPNKAIIFISDGRHNDDDNYLAVLNENFDQSRGFGGPMPPIYGIFMGRPIPDTAQLADLSRRTGGQFFLIPPQRPDSLNAVVARILDLVLLEYEPVTATVTNTTLDPDQIATSTAPGGFTLQTNGSWLMRLSDVIALSREDTNRINVSTQFREKHSGSVTTENISFVIYTTAPPADGSSIITNTQFSRVCYDYSKLTILNRAGADPAAFTQLDSAYQPYLRTSPIDLSSATAASVTRSKGDSESPSLSNRTAYADSTVFRGTFPFLVIPGTRTAGNGTLESSQFDTVVATWVHPRDAQDTARDTMLVRAANVGATAWFSLTEGGDPVTSYEANAERVFVVIRDQAADPRRIYTAMVTSDRFGSDSESVVLQVLSPGLLGGELPVSNQTKNRRDGLLQVSVGGDQLKVEYRDPIYGEVAIGNAGFDENIQESPRLEFTDADGNPLDSTAVWPPSSDKLHIRYSDDYAYGRVPEKQVSLSLVSRRYGAAIGADHERVTLTMASGSSGTRAAWTGSIDLEDAFPPSDSNGTAESRFRGEASITAFAHDNVGNAQSIQVSASLLVAYPDSQAVLTYTLADSGSVPAGKEGFIFHVADQDFSVAGNDSVAVSVRCARSGDSVSAFIARESGTGGYRTGVLVRDEGTPNTADRVLSCLSADQIVVRYVDPVYGTGAQLVIDEVARPVATPPGQSFAFQEFVSLQSQTPGAVIHYTVDGSTPVPGVSPVYSTPIQVTVTTTLKAIATRPGWKSSKVMTEVYTKTFTASRLELLDENGNAVIGGYLPGSASAVRIKLITTQAGLPSAAVDAVTRVAGDDEEAMLSNSAILGSALEYWQNVPLAHGKAGAAGNDTLEARGTDTLIAVWTNPFDPRDVARDTLVIKPAFVAAEVYFSLTEGGPRIATYPVGTDTLFIVVKSRPRDAGLDYRVTVTSIELGTDTEVLDLAELTPGTFSAKVPVGTAAKSAGDKVMQVAASGDQLTAVFVDPVYLSEHRGNAGFAQQVQESATLEFVDSAGRVLAPDEIWSPAAGKVYLRYGDDWNAGIDSLVKVRTARLTLVNRKGGTQVGDDSETVDLTLVSQAGTRGTWRGEIDLRDRASAASGNDTLETYFRGELAAAITPHDNGGIVLGADAADNLVIAYPDIPAEIVIRDTAGGQVDRVTRRVEIEVRDQIFTTSDGSFITVGVGCDATGDRLVSVRLTWNGTAYVAEPPILKGEWTPGMQVNTGDSTLYCKSTDRITVSYKDPVFSHEKIGEARWSDQKAGKLYFASARDSSLISSVLDGLDKDFQVYVEGLSPTRDKADTILVTLSTPGDKGDRETVKAVETGPMTGIFKVKVEFGFGTTDAVRGNGRIEADINRDQRTNRVILTAEATVDGQALKAELAMFSAYNMVVRAYMKDMDGDGRADRAYFVFDKKLARLPGSLEEVAWNDGDERFRQKAGASMLSIQGRDSLVVVADFARSPFGANLTDIPSGGKPYALFPSDNLFGGQRPALADSVGPVPVSAVKYPSNLNSYSVSTTEKRFYPDTLIVTVSEKLQTRAGWSEMLRFSKGCQGYDQTIPLKLAQDPIPSNSNPLEWTFIVDNAPGAQLPLVGDCIFLETDGRFTDVPGNLPARLGVELVGENPKLVIRDFRGFPPVAGMDPGSPGFVLVTNDKRDQGDGRWTSQAGNGSWQVVWIPPVGFDENDPVGGIMSKVPKDGPNSRPQQDYENQSLRPMPREISAVQVIATGRYIAHITIFDSFGNFVRTMKQSFGYHGEEKNPWRATEKGMRSFLVWDMKDANGSLVGQGAYVWKVNFAFAERKNEVMYTRTGVLRQ